MKLKGFKGPLSRIMNLDFSSKQWHCFDAVGSQQTNYAYRTHSLNKASYLTMKFPASSGLALSLVTKIRKHGTSIMIIDIDKLRMEGN